MFKRLLCALGLLVTFACERPLYMAGPETQLLSKLENPGDMQFQGSVSNLDFQMHGQLALELAVTRRLALRGHLLRGGDEWRSGSDRHFGEIFGYGAAAGTFYTISPWIKGTTWLGFGEGVVKNGHGSTFSLTNRYNRFYLEQQFRFNLGNVESYSVASFGVSHVFRITQLGTPQTEFNSLFIERQLSSPRAYYGTIGQGISVGSDAFRLHGRIDIVLGPARDQFARFHPFLLSGGLSWRISALPGFR